MKKFFSALSLSILLMLMMTIVVSADSLAIEAEDFELGNSARLVITKHSDASGGFYLYGAENNDPDAKSEDILGAIDGEKKITLSKEGNYTVYIRLANPSPYNGDSMWLSHDGVLHAVHFGVNHTNFYWYKVGIIHLEKGEHTLRIWSREMGAMIDKIILTDNPFFIPEGQGQLPERDAVYYEDGSGDVVAPLPAIVPPDEHPRLMVRKSDIPRIKANLEHPQNIDAYQKVLKKAESTLDGKQSSADSELYEIMQSKAFLYLINGDTQKGKEAVNMVMNHIDNVVIATTFANSDTNRSCGLLTFASACVYDWCYDLFTPEQREHYIKKMEDLITLNFEGGYPIVPTCDVFSTNFHRVENVLYRDLLAFGIAIYDEKPFVYNNIAGTLNMIYIPTLNWYYPSHWMSQGVSTYGDFRYVWELFCGYMFDALGQKPFDDGQHYSVYKSVYWRRPDGHYLTDGDETRKVFDNTYVKNNHALYLMTANMYNDPILKWQYYKNKASTDYTSASITGLSAPIYLIINDTTVDLENKAELPLTKYYPAPVGNMIARTSWQEGTDSPAVIAAFKPEGTYFSDHTHVETGNFVMYYKGMLALDSGSYEAPSYTKDDGTFVAGSEWGSAHYMNYLTLPIAHNTLMVYDPAQPADIKYGGQKMRPGAYNSWSNSKISDIMSGSHKVSETLEYDYGPDKQKPEYSYLESDLTYGYDDKFVDKYTRSYMFLNLFDDEIPAAVIIYDRLKAVSSSLEKSWLLHSQEEPRVEGNIVTIDRTELHNSGRLTNTVIKPDNFKIDKVGGKGYEYWNGQYNCEIFRQPVGDESGTWRIEIKPTDKSTENYFLNVLQVSDPDDNIVHHVVTSNEQGPFVGIFIADRAVFMKKDYGKISKDFSVSAEGNGDISYIITNLAEGRWSVKDKNGVVLACEAIDAENGVLRFRAPAGTYNIQWDYGENIQPKVFDMLGDVTMLDYTPVDIFVNGKTYIQRGRLEENTVMMPLEQLKKNTNDTTYTVDGDTIMAKGRVGEIKFTIGSKNAVLNGENVLLSVAPANFDNEIYIPMDECMKNVFEYIISDYDSLTHILYFRGGYYMVPGADFEIINVEDRNRADIITTTCSEIHAEGNEPNASLDDNFSTYWCSAGMGEWITYELAECYTLTGVGLAWSSGDQRKEHFAIHVSEDGVNWTQMWRGDSSGKTSGIEDFKFNKPVKAKYVKIECNQNTSNQMNSLLETHIYCTEKVPYYEK